MSILRLHPSLLACWLTLAGFTAAFVAAGNTEFLVYTVSLTVLIAFVQRTDRTLNYLPLVKWCFLAWLVMHMAGGFVHLRGIRLYDLVLVPLVGPPYEILRYDQFVHLFCYFVITGMLRSLVARIMAAEARRRMVLMVVVLSAMGVGALNELIEFSTVAFFGSTGVGDYTNNALDNVFNTAGAFLALMILPPPSPREATR